MKLFKKKQFRRTINKLAQQVGMYPIVYNEYHQARYMLNLIQNMDYCLFSCDGYERSYLEINDAKMLNDRFILTIKDGNNEYILQIFRQITNNKTFCANIRKFRRRWYGLKKSILINSQVLYFKKGESNINECFTCI